MSLEEFVQEILDEKGVSSLDEKVVESLKADLVTRIEDKVNREIIARIPKSKVSEFEDLLEKGNDKQVQEFIAVNVPNAPQIASQVMVQFKESYLGN